MTGHEAALMACFPRTSSNEPYLDNTLLLNFAQRSGSNYLSDLLISTGLFCGFRGILTSEQLNIYKGAGATKTLVGYLHGQRQIDDPNSRIWGIRASVNQLLNLWSRKVVPDFMQPLLVDLRRRDKIGQAVSLYIARETNSWTNTSPEGIEYDGQKILQSFLYINSVEANLDLTYGLLKREPSRIIYEELLECPDGTVDQLCRRLGVGSAKLDHAKLQRRVQRNELNEEFKQRFLADLDRLSIQWQKP